LQFQLILQFVMVIPSELVTWRWCHYSSHTLALTICHVHFWCQSLVSNYIQLYICNFS